MPLKLAGKVPSSGDRLLTKKINPSPVKSPANPLLKHVPSYVLGHTLLLPCHTLTRPKPGIPSTEMSGWCLESAGHEFLGWVL